MQILKLLYILILLCGLQPSFAKSDKSLFWQNNSEIYKRISENREILVVVNSAPAGEKFHLKMQGVGIASVPAPLSFKLAQDFEKLKQVSDYIKDVNYNKPKEQVYIHTEAFGYHAKMWLQVNVVEAPVRAIKFKIIRGTFTGMTGQINFKDDKRRRTQTEFLADYSYKELGIPQFFVEFGLEVVIQKIAAKMRAYIEQEYKNDKV